MDNSIKKDDRYLYPALCEYAGTDFYPLHMPGHKRRMASMTDPSRIDITEIDGFDNLHEAEGLLLQAQRRAARLYGAEESFFLVGGSTAGLLSAIGACAHSPACRGLPGEAGRTLSGCGTRERAGSAETNMLGEGTRERAGSAEMSISGGKILIARNCHKSVYHALYLNNLTPVYVYPKQGYFPAGIGGPVSADDVETALRLHPDVCAVVITSPTYDGVVSDVRRIAGAAHRFHVPLIVDEAHGAHFGMHRAFPASAVSQGADLVINSLHKTLPALTQTALLHVSGSLADRRMLRRMLSVYQTSSPSYVLMASIDECIRKMSESGVQLLEELDEMLERFYSITVDLKVLQIIRTDDPSRILIGTGESGLSGREICDILRHRYHLELEMGVPGYALALTSVGDDEEGLVRLAQALREIDMELDMIRLFPSHRRPDWLTEGKSSAAGEAESDPDPDRIPDISAEAPAAAESDGYRNSAGTEELQTVTSPAERPDVRLPLTQAWDAPSEPVLLEESPGSIAGEFVYLYPPGVPILVPGERITASLAETCAALRKQGFSFSGCEDPALTKIRVV